MFGGKWNSSYQLSAVSYQLSVLVLGTAAD
jgi:uncharacterized membrane protein YiaA